MTNAAKLTKKAVRIMLVGYPGAGKTGSLACLANAGYKFRILNFDGNKNLQSMLMNVKPEFMPNIDAVYLGDKMRANAAGGSEPVGIPQAYLRGLQLMDSWSYEEDGEKVDLGASKDWGMDTIVVLDSLTSMGRACMNRAMKLLNKTPTTLTDRLWGIAMGEQEAFVEKLTSDYNNHHVIVLAHLKPVGPNDVRAGDSDLTKDLKQRTADLLPTRLYPSALGKALPPMIGAHFPTVILVEPEYRGLTANRKLKFVPRSELDLKMPAPDLPKELGIEDGLLQVFKALGHTPPLAN